MAEAMYRPVIDWNGACLESPQRSVRYAAAASTSANTIARIDQVCHPRVMSGDRFVVRIMASYPGD